MERTENLIIEQLRCGNERAYKFLYDNHYRILCHIAKQYVHDDFLSESIVGDTIFHIWEIRETLHIKTSIRSYLVQSVRNRCLDYLKSQYHQKEICMSTIVHQNDVALGTIHFEHPLGRLLEGELESKIQGSIEQLPDACKRVFKLSRFERKSNNEIARLLGISVNTVKYHIKQALHLLRADLEKYLVCFLWLLF